VRLAAGKDLLDRLAQGSSLSKELEKDLPEGSITFEQQLRVIKKGNLGQLGSESIEVESPHGDE